MTETECGLGFPLHVPLMLTPSQWRYVQFFTLPLLCWPGPGSVSRGRESSLRSVSFCGNNYHKTSRRRFKTTCCITLCFSVKLLLCCITGSVSQPGLSWVHFNFSSLTPKKGSHVFRFLVFIIHLSHNMVFIFESETNEGGLYCHLKLRAGSFMQGCC